MMLYVNGQDIRKFTLALVRGNGDVSVCEYETSPEQFLFQLDAFLNKEGVRVGEIERIVTVIGPGSATALRSILSIVNTMQFVQGIEVLGVEKDPEIDDKKWIERIMNKDLDMIIPKPFLQPTYAHGPRITISKKDHLKRT